MIACPTCEGDTIVLETRDAEEYVRRRRICKNTSCGTKVTTVELVLHNAKRRAGGPVVMIRRADLDKLHELSAKMLELADKEVGACRE